MADRLSQHARQRGSTPLLLADQVHALTLSLHSNLCITSDVR
jgi:hypothetical protein